MKNLVCSHLEVFRKLQEELFVDPQLLKRTPQVPFGMQLFQISFYVVILVEQGTDLGTHVITDVLSNSNRHKKIIKGKYIFEK